MKITKNLEMLEIKVPRDNGEMIYYPTLTWDDKHLVLFDTGLPATGKLIAEAIKNAGFDVKDLTDIILTHQDIDHIGGCRELLELAPKTVLYAHELDAEFIEGNKVPTKLDAMEQLVAAGQLPVEREGFYQMLKTGFASSSVTINKKLNDGDVLDFCGSIETVFTPGHTPGHASFYLQSSKIMITGDAANIAGSKLVGSNPGMTWNMEVAEKSLEKIKNYDMAGVISYHTGYMEF